MNLLHSLTGLLVQWLTYIPATDVENIYADEEEEQAEANSYDELDMIKRNAGINPVVLDALGDDEPLDV